MENNIQIEQQKEKRKWFSNKQKTRGIIKTTKTRKHSVCIEKNGQN